MSAILVVLESMWTGRAGEPAPRWFPISEKNHSGKRLHRILRIDPREGNVWVTNVCPMQQESAKHHGMPDADTLRANIVEYPRDLGWLIVGGKVAQATFRLIESSAMVRSKLSLARALFIPHPAARFWTKAMEADIASFIAGESFPASIVQFDYRGRKSGAQQFEWRAT